MDNLKIIATAAFGLEAVLARELDHIGIQDHNTLNGRIYYNGTARDLIRSNLWLRTADRILLNFGEFKAVTFEELFQNIKKLPWEELLPENAVFIVNARSQKSKLFSLRDIQAITKKAIAEKLKTAYNKEWISETGPRYMIEVAFLNDEAVVTVDSSGHGLNKRGYREEVGKSPIKETLAAGLIMISRWRKDRALIDPFCGTGTFGIEAAMIGLNIAPGLKQSFDAENWSIIPKELWEEERTLAEEAIDKETKLKIYCSDIDYYQLKLAKKHAELAGVLDQISFQKLDFSETGSKYEYGFFITNPPYGERLLEKEEAESIYKRLGQHYKKFPTWSLYVITSDENFERIFGKKADKKRKIYNGGLKCDYYQYFGLKPKNK